MSEFNAEPASLSRQTTERSIVYVGAAQAWRIALSLVSAVIFARLLKPSDFGLVAMVAPVVAFAALVQDMGLSQVTVQRKRVTPEFLSALFWLNAGVGLFLAAGLVAASPALSAFYGHQEVAALASAFALVVLVTSLQIQHVALLNRRMEFLKIAVIETVSATLGFAAGLFVAIVWASYWALFVTSFTTVLLSGIFFWGISGWKPGRCSFEGQFKETVSFGSGLTGHSLLSFLARNADNVLIGRFHGSTALGLYDRAYKLLLLPISQVNMPLGRVMISLLSRLQGDARRYTSAYHEALTALMAAMQPPIIVLIVFAWPLFELLLGREWVEAAPIFQILGICGLQQILTNTFFWLFVSQGRGRELFLLSVFRSVTTLAAFVVGLPWGPIGVAAAYAISDIVLRLPVQMWVVTRQGPVTLASLLSAVQPHLAAMLVSTGVALASSAYDSAFPLLQAAVALFLCYASYLVILLLFREKRAVILPYVYRTISMLKLCCVRHPSSR